MPQICCCRNWIAGLACVVACTAALMGPHRDRLLAQTSAITSFPAPTAVPPGTTVRVAGVASLSGLNQRLKQQFEQQFPGTQVQVEPQDAETALAALVQDQLEVAAIDRPLTAVERSSGLAATLAGREKIVFVVGASNPLQTPLTAVQLVQILNGEITDWAEVGREPGPIQVIDRPADNSTRRSLQRYSLLQETQAATRTALSDNQMSTVVSALDRNSISYATIAEARNQPPARVITLPDVSVTDPRYPFSQPLLYVHKTPEPSPVTQAFLGFVSAPTTQQTIAERLATVPQSSVPAPSAASSKSFVTKDPIAPETRQPKSLDRHPAATQPQQVWMWLLLPLTGLAGLVLWIFTEGQSPTPTSEITESERDRSDGNLQ